MSQRVEARKAVLNLIQRVFHHEFIPNFEEEENRLKSICESLEDPEKEEYISALRSARNFNEICSGKSLGEVYGEEYFKARSDADNTRISNTRYVLEARILANGHYVHKSPEPAKLKRADYPLMKV